jgi:hypothetical protein
MSISGESVLCIVGDSRSGSSVLQGLFELHRQVTVVGELRRLELFIAEGRDCGCGKPVRDCEHWSDIISRANLRPQDVRTRAPRTRLLKRFEEGLAFSGATMRVPQLTLPFLYRGRTVADHSSRLLSAAAARANARVVVDSSKDPGHAVYLLHQKKLPVHVVFLCRDGRGTVWSKISRTGISPELASRHWAWTTRSMLALRHALGTQRSSWIRYEELCADPLTVVRRIADRVGLERDGFGETAPAVRHDIGGSPGFAGATFATVHEDMRWREEMPRAVRSTFDEIGGDLNRRLDYA